MRITNDSVRRAHITHTYVYWDDLFTDDELNKICEISKNKPLDAGKTLGDSYNSSNYRISEINFSAKDETNEWIFNRLNNLIEYINDTYFNYDLNGYEVYQYAEYDSTKFGKYNYHMDLSNNGSNLQEGETIETRKLSFSLLLNDPDVDFDGGDFVIKLGEEDTKIEFKKGRIVFFPSYLLHKVTPVTKGIRKSLVVWVTGPKFR
jgi:PKHD-type hydroxylase